MKKRYLFLCFLSFILFDISVLAQKNGYYIPLDIQQTYQKQTRNAMGMPGVNYWQNEVNYAIKAELDSTTTFISGTAEIHYINHSPDSLDRLVFNLYQDIFRKGNSRDWDIGLADLHEGTEINRLEIDGKEVDTKNNRKLYRQGTKLIVKLQNSIAPTDTTIISIDWRVMIPQTRTVRMGKYSDSVCFVAYWYPQLAVYDDIDGWDMISYNGSVEFYNEFADYNVSLTIPSGFAVWATGTLENADEVYHHNVYERLNKARQSDEIIQIIRKEDYTKNEVLKSDSKKVWIFEAQKVPDFSFGVGKGMLWDASGLVVDNASKRSVLISAVYPEDSPNYKEVAAYSRKSIQYMSEVMPGIPYPYPAMTTISNGRGGGMETPMMANNGAPKDVENAFSLTFHEIAHSYMPFFMGTNEKKYAWMDEGWATLWPYVMMDSLYPHYQYLEKSVEGFERSAGKENDVPPMVPNQLLASNYASLRLASYVRPAMAYYFLEDALGTEVFVNALRFYMNTWKGKHPMPMDFIRSFELVSDRDLGWFFNPWLFRSAYPDLSIKKITEDGFVIIENKGGLPLPIVLEMIYTDQSKEEISYSSSIWDKEETAIMIEIPMNKKVQEIQLGNKRIPDVNRKDNYMLLID